MQFKYFGFQTFRSTMQVRKQKRYTNNSDLQFGSNVLVVDTFSHFTLSHAFIIFSQLISLSSQSFMKANTSTKYVSVLNSHMNIPYQPFETITNIAIN